MDCGEIAVTFPDGMPLDLPDASVKSQTFLSLLRWGLPLAVMTSPLERWTL